MERVGESENLELKYLWHHQDYPSKSGALPPEISSHMFGYLQDNDFYKIDSTESIDANYAKHLQGLNVQSCLIFPIKMQNRIFGFIGIDECSKIRSWSQEEIRLIRILADLVSHAILQKITQNELKHSTDILNTVLDNVHAMIAVIEIETDKILYLNQYARNVFGDVIGEVCWKQLHGDLTSPCDNCPRPGYGEYKDQDVVIKDIQNSHWKRWYHTTNTIIEWKDGQKAHLEIAIDITDRMETEKQFRLTTKRLEELNKTKDKFFSIVAHDLKNPLFSLMGFAEIIRNNNQQLSPDEITEYSDLIYQSARNTHQLLQNLLTWSQSQTGKLRFNPMMVNMNQLLENAVEFVRPIAKQKQIRIEKDFQTEKALSVDPNMITAAVRNLLTNAVKFTPQDGLVRLKYYQQEGQYCIDVQDSGIGMSADDIDKLFRIDVDHRSIGKSYTDAKGTGLGLILVKEFVNLHNGRVRVQSVEDEGSVFTLCLPDTEEE
jgi:signal transduction histidine kinase